MPNTIAYRNGYAAYMRGEALKDNPHLKSPQEWHEWNRGFKAAKLENK